MAKRSKITSVKHIPTRKLQEIVDSAPYYVTSEGTEYHDQIDEIRAILAGRMARKNDKEMKQHTNVERLRGRHDAVESGRWYCSRCDTVKDTEEFYKRSDGSGKPRTHCKTCMKNNDVPF